MELESVIQGRKHEVPNATISSRPPSGVTPIGQPFERWGSAAQSPDADSDDSEVSPIDSNASALRTETIPPPEDSRPRSHSSHTHHTAPPTRPSQRTTSETEFNALESSGTLVLNA